MTELSEAARKEANRAHARAYYWRNRDKCIEKSKTNNLKRNDAVVKYRKDYRARMNELRRTEEYKKRRSESRKIRRICDPSYKVQCHCRNRIRNALKASGLRRRGTTQSMLGCTVVFLKSHLESKFKDGMNWGNYGYYGWHIDHIKPLSSAKTIEEIEALCHYTNLQPLWANENLKKSNND